MLIKLAGSFLMGCLITYCFGFLYVNYKTPAKLYHCHGKHFFLMESIKPNGSVYVKTSPEKLCLDIRGIK